MKNKMQSINQVMNQVKNINQRMSIPFQKVYGRCVFRIPLKAIKEARASFVAFYFAQKEKHAA